MPERESEQASSPLLGPVRLPEPRRALPAAEWVWRDKRAFPKNNQELFAAQFVLGMDLGDPPDVHEPSRTSSIDRDELSAAPQSVPQRQIVERDSPFQARLRGWLRSE